MSDGYNKERLKRDLERLMIAVGQTKRRPVRSYLLRTWRRIIALIAWPFRFKQRRLERERRRAEVERIRAEVLRGMQDTRDAILHSLKQGREILEGISAFMDARKERLERLFASFPPHWSVKETGQSFDAHDLEWIFSRWRIRFNT